MRYECPPVEIIPTIVIPVHATAKTFIACVIFSSIGKSMYDKVGAILSFLA